MRAGEGVYIVSVIRHIKRCGRARYPGKRKGRRVFRSRARRHKRRRRPGVYLDGVQVYSCTNVCCGRVSHVRQPASGASCPPRSETQHGSATDASQSTSLRPSLSGTTRSKPSVQRNRIVALAVYYTTQKGIKPPQLFTHLTARHLIHSRPFPNRPTNFLTPTQASCLLSAPPISLPTSKTLATPSSPPTATFFPWVFSHATLFRLRKA